MKDRNCRSFARRAPDERNPSKYGALRRIRTSDRSVRSRVQAGRGFAVVADEVRNLAHRAQESAQQIQKMIEELQIGAQEAVSTMTESQRYSLESVEIANRAGERLSSDLLHAMQALSQLSYSPEFAIRRAIFRSLRQPSGHRHAHPLLGRMNMKWRPLGDSNPCYRRERAVCTTLPRSGSRVRVSFPAPNSTTWLRRGW